MYWSMGVNVEGNEEPLTFIILIVGSFVHASTVLFTAGFRCSIEESNPLLLELPPELPPFAGCTEFCGKSVPVAEGLPVTEGLPDALKV